jgi:hypothetical protein
MITTNHLFEGEAFNQKIKSQDTQISLSDDEINEKYKKGEMRIVTEQGRINLDSISNLLDSTQGEKKKYILNPEYQRRKRWSNRQKSLLIESFIMNVPIPPIFLYEIEYAVYEVMDGLQRLTAIYDFYNEKFALEGLEYWQELNGRTYSKLPSNVRAGIDRRYLSSIILLEETAKSKEDAEFLKQIVFERLNSGGEKLSPQETRNALYNGKFNQLCIKLAENELFRKMWQLPLEKDVEELLLKSESELEDTEYSVKKMNSYRRMDDVELVLRFFAYRHIDKLTSPIDKFLDNYLNQANQYSNEILEELEELFIKTINTVYEIFQENAFLLPSQKKTYKSPSKTIYDPLMQAFAMNITYTDELIQNKEEIKKLYNSEYDSQLFDGRYNNRKDVQNRIAFFDTFLQKCIS